MLVMTFRLGDLADPNIAFFCLSKRIHKSGTLRSGIPFWISQNGNTVCIDMPQQTSAKYYYQKSQ